MLYECSADVDSENETIHTVLMCRIGSLPPFDCGGQGNVIGDSSNAWHAVGFTTLSSQLDQEITCHDRLVEG